VSKKPKKLKKDWPSLYHEGMDRTYIIGNMIYELIEGHPAIKKSKNKEKVQAAADLLNEVYQSIGSHYWNYEDKKEVKSE